jgi:hypothetical protein
MPGNLRIGWTIIRDGRRHGLRRAKPVDLHDPGHDCSIRGLPDERGRDPGGQRQIAKSNEPPVAGLDAGWPMRSSQTCAAF